MNSAQGFDWSKVWRSGLLLITLSLSLSLLSHGIRIGVHTEVYCIAAVGFDGLVHVPFFMDQTAIVDDVCRAMIRSFGKIPRKALVL